MIWSRIWVTTPIVLISLIAINLSAQKKQARITSVEPEGGPPGTKIVINGENFSADEKNNRVFLGSVPLTIQSVFPSYIQTVIPSNAKTAIITVEVKKLGKVSSPTPFVVTDPLAVSGISHLFGPPGSAIKIKGTGFSKKVNNNTVVLGVMRCTVTAATSNELSVTIPQKAKTGEFPLKVEVKGIGKVVFKDKFLVAYQPTIASFTPESAIPGETIAIQGEHFGKDPARIDVRLGNTPCQVVSVLDNEVQVVVPKNATGGTFQLSVNKIKSAPSTKAFALREGLKATNMTPRSVSPGGEIKIFGGGFSKNASDHTLKIGSISTKAIRIEGGALVFRIPKNVSPGNNPVQLIVRKGGTINIPIPLVIQQSATVTNFAPNKGAVNTQVTIYGTGFGSSSSEVRVFFGNQQAQLASVKPNAITALVPQGATSARLTVQTKANGVAYSDKIFGVMTTVTISGFAPTSGAPDQQVRLYGQGFDPKPAQNKVTLGNKNVRVLQSTPTNLLVQIPKNASSGSFRVTVGDGVGEAGAPFTVMEPTPTPTPTPVPVAVKFAITDFNPKSGTPGTYVTITGSGFTSTGMRAYVGRSPAGMRVYSANQAIIAVPNIAASGPIILTSQSGVSTQSKKNFDLQTQISITKFYPLTGRPGTRVTIYGSDFVPNRTQVFLGKRQLRVEPGATTQMMAVTIPPGSESGPFSVQVPGKPVARSVSAFRVAAAATIVPTQQAAPKADPALEFKPGDKSAVDQLMAEEPKETPEATVKRGSQPAPSIDALLGFESEGEKLEIKSIDPTEGPVGETITVNGSGFGDNIANVTAWVGNVKAKVLGVVPDIIMIEVPGGVTTGKVKLKISNKPSLTSKEDFIVIGK